MVGTMRDAAAATLIGGSFALSTAGSSDPAIIISSIAGLVLAVAKLIEVVRKRSSRRQRKDNHIMAGKEDDDGN